MVQQQHQLGKMVKKEIYTAVLVTQHRIKAPKTKTKTRQNHHGKHIPHICHGHTDGVRGEKSCHVEKFQISVHETCGES